MKIRYKNKFDKNRRDFLKVLTGAGICKGLYQASPLVGGMMLSRLAESQAATPNKSVIVYVPNGCIPDNWFPDANLNNFPAMSAPYAELGVQNECHFLRDMRHHNGGHGLMPVLMNNRWDGDSFDVNIARCIGENTVFPYVNLGVHSNGHGTMTKENGVAVPFEDNPFNAFERLFGNGSTASDPRFNIIDAHKDALSALGNKLGTYEKERLDSHVTAIEETQNRLIALGEGLSCSTGSPPAQFPLEPQTFEQQAKLQADIIVLALQCNLTSSCSLGLGNHQGEFSMPYLNFQGIYHASIHGGNGGDPTYPHFSETRAHLSSLSAYLIDRLRVSGLLDTTIFCEISDMGDGDGHGSTKIPLIMAGGGGVIRRGLSNAGSENYTVLNMLHTSAAILGADQHPSYQGYADNVVPGLIA